MQYALCCIGHFLCISLEYIFSFPKQDTLHIYALHKLPVFCNVTPCRFYIIGSSRRTILVLGRPRGLLCPRGIHSVTPDCPSVVMSLRHVIRPSVFAFSYVPDNVCHTTLFVDLVCTLSVLQGDSYHDSLHLPLGCDQFLKLGVAK